MQDEGDLICEILTELSNHNKRYVDLIKIDRRWQGGFLKLKDTSY